MIILLHEIGVIYAEHNGTYGYRRIADEYNATHEKQYNLKRFYRLVHIVGLLTVICRKRPAYHSSTPEVTPENILNRNSQSAKSETPKCQIDTLKYTLEELAVLDLIKKNPSVKQTELAEQTENTFFFGRCQIRQDIVADIETKRLVRYLVYHQISILCGNTRCRIYPERREI